MKKFLPALALLMAAAAVSAQSAQKISQIVESPELSYGQAAYIALSYSDAETMDESADDAQAFEAAFQRKWIKNGAVVQAAIRLDELSALYLSAVGIKGGVLCGLIKNSPRYSFRELKALGLLDQYADPAMKIDGQNALNLFNACVQAAEGER